MLLAGLQIIVYWLSDTAFHNFWVEGTAIVLAWCGALFLFSPFFVYGLALIQKWLPRETSTAARVTVTVTTVLYVVFFQVLAGAVASSGTGR